MLFIVKLGETVRADHPHCFGHRAKKCRWNVATSISLMQQYKQKCNGLLIYFLPNDLLYPKALTSLTQKIQLHLHLSTLLPVGMFNVSLSHEVNLHKHVVWRGSWKFWRLCMDVAIYVDIHIDICIKIYIYISSTTAFVSHTIRWSFPSIRGQDLRWLRHWNFILKLKVPMLERRRVSYTWKHPQMRRMGRTAVYLPTWIT